MNRGTEWKKVLLVLGMGVLILTFTLAMSAQVKTQTTTTEGAATREVEVERAEVILVQGNDVVVKMEDGTIRHVSNVPESARVTVDGKELGVHDLKPGMKLQRTITTTTTPKIITTTQSVTGKVWHVNPPSSVILTLEDGQNQQFKVPKGQKFTIDGQETDVWGLKKGMVVSATKVVEEPITSVTQQKLLAGKLPPPPPPDVPIMIAVAEPTPAPPVQVAEKAPAQLPKTGSILPLIGLLGCLSLTASGLSRFFRWNR
jgi:hypothetical protein